MKIIAIDSSGITATVALASEDRVIAEYSVNNKKTHSQTLLPMLDEICKMTQTDMSEIEAIAVAAGPGSFTGLRIGSASAKGLGLALNVPIIPVPTLEGLAYNGWGFDGVVCPMMDARRSQVYTGIYEFVDGEIVTVEDQCADDVLVIVDKLNKLGKKVLLLGDGAAAYRDKIEQNLTAEHVYAPIHRNTQSAASVAAAAFKRYEQGKTEDAADHRPDYLRVSQAERERAARISQEKGEA